MLAGCSASVVAQRSGGQVDLGMSIDDFVKMCGQPVGKEMYEENGVRYDRYAKGENRSGSPPWRCRKRSVRMRYRAVAAASLRRVSSLMKSLSTFM